MQSAQTRQTDASAENKAKMANCRLHLCHTLQVFPSVRSDAAMMPLFSGIISTNLEILAASRIFVPMSAQFVSVDSFWTLKVFFATMSWTQSSFNDKCFTRPTPCRAVILFAAEEFVKQIISVSLWISSKTFFKSKPALAARVRA